MAVCTKCCVRTHEHRSLLRRCRRLPDLQRLQLQQRREQLRTGSKTSVHVFLHLLARASIASLFATHSRSVTMMQSGDTAATATTLWTPVNPVPVARQTQICLRSSNYPQCKVRHQHSAFYIHEIEANDEYRLDAVFVLRPGPINGTSCLESVNYPQHFVSVGSNGRLQLRRYDPTDEVDRSISFVVEPGLNKAPYSISLRVCGEVHRYVRHRNYELWADQLSVVEIQSRKLTQNDATFLIRSYPSDKTLCYLDGRVLSQKLYEESTTALPTADELIHASSSSSSSRTSISYQKVAAELPAPQRQLEELKQLVSSEDAAHAACVIVGAGPIGLWFAIQFKLQQPHKHVILFERYAEYRRKHVLLLRKTSFVRCFYNEDLEKSVSAWTKSKYVRTTELEEQLSAIASKLGIVKYQYMISSPSTLSESFPNCELFVGCDGAHSICRTELFHEDVSVKKDLEFIIECKYEARSSETLSFPSLYKTQKALGCIITEHCGKPIPSNTSEVTIPCTVRFIVDKATYALVSGATFKNPYTLDTLPDRAISIKKMFEVYFRIKQSQAHEERIVGAEKISALTIGFYQASSFMLNYTPASRTTPIHWFLVGDSAFGVPYFRSLNCGLWCSTELARALSYYCDHDKSFQRVHTWMAFMKAKTMMEIGSAKVKDVFIKIGGAFTKLMSKFPSLISWKKSDVSRPTSTSSSSSGGNSGNSSDVDAAELLQLMEEEEKRNS